MKLLVSILQSISGLLSMKLTGIFTTSVYLGTAYLISFDKHRYGKLVEDTSNVYLKGNNEYTKSLMDAYQLVSMWINDPSYIMNVTSTSNDGLIFVHTATPIPHHDRRTVTCINCQKLAISTIHITKAQASQQP